MTGSDAEMESVEINKSAEETTTPSAENKKGSESSTASKRRSTFFKNKRFSFFRSAGQRGADLDTLRGTTGADFEGLGRIHRAAGGIGCLCFAGQTSEKGANKERYLFIKGPHCFIYNSETSSTPKYAISLANVRAEVKPVAHGRHPVVLMDNLGDVQYELSFASDELAKQFANVVRAEANVAQTEEARKRLGHGHLITKRSSLRYIETVAKKKLGDQPEKPITTGEIAENYPAIEPM